MNKCPDCGSVLIGMYPLGVRCSAWPKCGWLSVELKVWPPSPPATWRFGT